MTLYIISFIIVLIDVIIGAKLINCPNDSIRYEKIIGLYPPEKYQKLLLYQQQQQQQQPITLECFEKCNQLKNCQSFVIFYNISTCYYYQTTIIENYNEQKQYNYDINTVWLKKFCLNNDNNIRSNCKKLWIFERIPGATLIHNSNNTKHIQQYLTRTECQQYCLDQQQFVCRSIKFKINYNYNDNDEIKGICILLNTDRFQSPNSYRISNYDDEYFENQCTENFNQNNHGFCAYDEYENATILTHHDLLFQQQTKDNCQELCDNLTIFNCRSFSLIDNQCYLYSVDSKLLGPKLIKYQQLNNHYYERTKCLNLTVQCNDKEMIINYLPDIDFNGILYMDGFIDKPSCSINRNNNNNLLILKLSLIENNYQYNCGLIKARNQLMNRTLIGGRLILQYNRFIQTQNDRIIRIGCIFNYNQNNNNRIIVGSGITINTNSSTIHSSHLFNLTNTNNNNGDNPKIEMRIIDYNTKKEVSNTEIGQELELIIELKPKTLYDFRAYDLIAMTENGQDSIFLLDDNGCPINTNIFPKFTKQITNNSRQLIGRFQAFKFVSSTIVRFSVIVEFCSKMCPDIDCNQKQRYKRELVENNSTIINVNRNEFDNQFRNHGQLPLELIMIVRNSSGVIADRLVIGDHKILVAGYDYINNEVCFDYSLFIGLIILWILIQIIFLICTIMIIRYYKKYYEEQIGHLSLQDLHKNFDMGYTNRHVHWADNEEFT